MIRDSVRIGLPEKKDREILLKKFMKGRDMNFETIAKFL